VKNDANKMAIREEKILRKKPRIYSMYAKVQICLVMIKIILLENQKSHWMKAKKKE
jgi:hypothetical protein